MIVQAAGLDTIIVHAEHSTISAEATLSISAAALALGMTPMVRIASHAASAIGAALDGGALGLIVPRVETRAEAEAIAAEARYPPLGRRSVARAGRHDALPRAAARRRHAPAQRRDAADRDARDRHRNRQCRRHRRGALHPRAADRPQ